MGPLAKRPFNVKPFRRFVANYPMKSFLIVVYFDELEHMIFSKSVTRDPLQKDSRYTRGDSSLRSERGCYFNETALALD